MNDEIQCIILRITHTRTHTYMRPHIIVKRIHYSVHSESKIIDTNIHTFLKNIDLKFVTEILEKASRYHTTIHTSY